MKLPKVMYVAPSGEGEDRWYSANPDAAELAEADKSIPAGKYVLAEEVTITAHVQVE